jgi:branched-chain amino acid transport system substrate-binding protein
LTARPRRLGLIALIAGAALSGCGGSSATSNSIEGVDAHACGPVEYGGSGTPRALLVSDLPMRGESAERSRQQVDAIRLELQADGWKAEPTTVGFQACDDSIPPTGLWDAARCRSNAHAYADDPRVVGVIGTYNSGCAAAEIPILNRAGLMMVSPGNTAICLTQGSPLCRAGQPRSLYPTGRRTYARVVPSDSYQSAALAQLAEDEGIARPFVLYAQGDPTSLGQAASFRAAARDIGLRLAGLAPWNPKSGGYAALFDRVRASGADGVVLAGLTEENTARVIRDKVAALGPNARVPLIAYDGLAQQATIDRAGAASRGMFAGLPGLPPDKLTDDGATLVGDLESELGGRPVEQYAPPAGEAAAVFMDAIEAAGPHRAGIVKAVFVSRGGGILGDYRFQRSGDPTVDPVTILRAGSSFTPVREIRPDPHVARAARVRASRSGD